MDDLSPYLTRVIAIANGKGGAGKTSVAVNLAGSAARAGWRVLLIDLDPQGNVEEDLGYDDNPANDRGLHLSDAVARPGVELQPVLRQIRPNLDVIPGGEHLDDLDMVLLGRSTRRRGDTSRLLAEPLARLAGDYDLILIDTPPTRPILLDLALMSARWIVIPTKSDRASIKGLSNLAGQLAPVREQREDIDVLGAVLFGVTSGASTVRKNAIDDISDALGGVAPVFETVIRHSEATATEARYDGKLVHEIADKVENAEPYYAALKAGRTPERLPGAAPRLAGDYELLAQEVLGALTAKLGAGAAGGN